MVLPGVLLLLYAVAGIADCVRTRRKKSRIVKPFLMPLLGLFYIAACRAFQLPVSVMLLLALSASFAGDVLLIFSDRQVRFLVTGGLFFGLAHVCYVLLFLQDIPADGLRGATPYLIAPLTGVAAGIFLCRLVFAQFRRGARKYALFYAVLLISMCVASSLRVYFTEALYAAVAFAGALLFAYSDSLLAMNVAETIRGEERTKNRWIMQTYLLAQLLITTAQIMRQSAGA